MLFHFVGCDENSQLEQTTLSRAKLAEIDDQFARGQIDQADSSLNDYLKQFPDSYQGWALKGWINVRRGNLAEAEKLFRKVLQLNPTWDNAYVGLGVVARKSNRDEQARKYYLKAIELSANNAEAYSSLVLLEIKAHNIDKAIDYGERAYSISPLNPSIAANLCWAYHLHGDDKNRDKYFEIAERLQYSGLEALKQRLAD
jgi:Flp pilus assembly protein TadD